jgi:aminomethyltransferase
VLHPTIRRSPYFERTLAHGACDFMVYNHTYMPMGYGRNPRDD